MHDVFLSYSRKDYDIVRIIKSEIELFTRAKCWMDIDGISYTSSDFVNLIAPAIQKAKIFIFILTLNSQESQWARNELLLAKKSGKYIFFLSPDDCEMLPAFILEYGHYNVCMYSIDYQKRKLFSEINQTLEADIWEILDILKVNKKKEDNRLQVGMSAFSVSPSKKVFFSLGNLQYNSFKRQWRSAEHQWDIIGEENMNISQSYNGWIDLFGWGTGDMPFKSSTKDKDYGTFNLWVADGWSVLTHDEWWYVLHNRKCEMRYVKANVNGVNGVILFPDYWDKASYNFIKPNEGDVLFSNVISQSVWESKLEPKGAVFLPAAGYRYGKTINGVGAEGAYWSSDTWYHECAHSFYFRGGSMDGWHQSKKRNGLSVRLVKVLN